jgi:hypothetical protein
MSAATAAERSNPAAPDDVEILAGDTWQCQGLPDTAKVIATSSEPSVLIEYPDGFRAMWTERAFRESFEVAA